jgi:lysophospholipase L1-like esterase
MARAQTALRRLLAIGLGIALALLGAEGLLRLRYGRSIPERLPLMTVAAHPTRGYALVPGADHFTYQHPVRVNSLGLRGPEPRAPRAARRVLLLGDSLVYGQGVSDAETLPALLERELAAHGDFEVFNAGLRAYATHQELAWLDELGPLLQPDIVVLCWYWNDLEERDVARTRERLERSGPIAFDLSAPARGWALWAWRSKQLLRRSTLAMVLWDALNTADRLVPEAAQIDAGFERLQAYLQRFAGRCAEIGAQARFVTLPDAIGLEGSKTRGLEERALELARAAGLPAFDLRPALEGFERPPTLPFDGHFDGRGNRALAGRLANWLVAAQPPAEAVGAR